MTAIAFRDGILACDRQVTWGSVKTVVCKYRKVDIPNLGPCVVVMSGYINASDKIFHQLRSMTMGTGEPLGDMKILSRYGFAITKDLAVHGIYGDGFVGSAEHPDNPFFAEGSAFEFLTGAMAAGKSAPDAVNLACQYLESCGQGVDIVDVKGYLSDEIF